MRTVLLCLLVVFVFHSVVVGQDFVVLATWNVGLRDLAVADLDLDGFGSEVDADILVLNEVKTIEQVQEICLAMNRDDDFMAISNFRNGDADLEVGIVSRYPLSDVVEFDPFPDAGQVEPQEIKLERVDLEGIHNVNTSRGFLMAKVPALNCFIIATHLKSSLGESGESDYSNAKKRELVAAAIADRMNVLIEDHPEATVFVLGDFNVGVSDSKKNGTDLLVDDFEGSGDRYDETHALLKGSLVDDLRMVCLADNLGSTDVGDDNVPDYVGAGAIDAIYTIGPASGLFSEAKAASDSYGSDHWAVYTRSNFQTNNEICIKKLLPNPDGQDAGHESITLENSGESVLPGSTSMRQVVFPGLMTISFALTNLLNEL